jgi:hypothetical protein
VLLLVLPKLTFLTGINVPTETSMAAYFLMWGLFTFGMFFGTLKVNRALQFVFMSLVILFFMLTIRELTSNPTPFRTITFKTITGIEGVICARQLVAKMVLNGIYSPFII